MKLRIVCISALSLLAAHMCAANEARTKEDLSAVQQEIKRSQNAYRAQKKTIAKLQKKLKTSAREVSSHARELRKIESQVASNKIQIKQTKAELKIQLKRKSTLEHILSKQLKAAYMSGTHDYSKLLLNQESSAALERTISYYQYLNTARLEQLDELKLLLTSLDENQAKLTLSQQNLNTLFSTQSAQLDKFKVAQKQSRQDLNALNSKLEETQAALAYLRENEQILKQTLSQLAQLQTQKPLTLSGLKQRKGKLNFPVNGKIRYRFGQKKHQGLNWKGVVIGQKEGTPVKNIAPGKVVFADWLNGYGWVIVLDHGKGFMSLYGHAQTLLFDVGDTVAEDETLALVGQSGGQKNPGLYFELRHKGSAVDPVKWCRQS